MATIRKRTGTSGGKGKTAWVVDYFDQNRKRHLKTFERKKDAEDWLERGSRSRKARIRQPRIPPHSITPSISGSRRPACVLSAPTSKAGMGYGDGRNRLALFKQEH
jgi:hypothetical protein